MIGTSKTYPFKIYQKGSNEQFQAEGILITIFLNYHFSKNYLIY